MSDDALDNLRKIGKLTVEPPDRTEIAGLIRSGTDLLSDAKNATLKVESRFSLAYNAAHAFARAALRAEGYRCKERYLVFQCLKHTLGLPGEQWRVLDRAHRLRNIAEYEGTLDTDELLTIIDALIRTTDAVGRRLKKNMPQ